MTTTARGSQWLRWEPHIHTPGTVHEDNYGADSWDDYLTALEQASPALSAIGITDYCVTRSYEQARVHKDAGRLPDCNLLFPNLELRLNTGTVKGNFVNIHLLVCPDDPNHLAELNRFLSQLIFNAFGDKFVCTKEDLIRLGRKADSALTEDESALRHGCSQFKVSLDNLLATHRDMTWAAENIVVAVAGNADGTSGLKDAADATLRKEIEKASHAVFASSPKQRDFWLGSGKASISELHERYGGPKPCLWGSDAHELARVAKPDEDRLCWIKGAAIFDALRQACIDPERAYVGPVAPQWTGASRVIDQIELIGAPWANTPVVALNSGLVAVIGARGSGKTALADVIAAACDAYDEMGRSSFLSRAREHLFGASVTLKWLNGEERSRDLDSPINDVFDSYPRARYLSQQFVEELCSVEGMPRLIREIERVIFESHPSGERDGATDFGELLDLRAQHLRDARAREDEAVANLSDQIGIEMDKSRLVTPYTTQVDEKQKEIARLESDRAALLPKGKSTTADRLNDLTIAADKVRGHLRLYALQQGVLTTLRAEVQDLRQNRAPRELRALKENHQRAAINDQDWSRFLLTYSGDVDAVVATQAATTQDQISAWRGTPPTGPIGADGSFLAPAADLTQTPFAILEAEIARLQKLLAADAETAKRLVAATKRISDETTTLARLRSSLEDCQGARARADAMVADRERAYIRVFDAILEEERVLNDLYAPLMPRLSTGGQTLAKLAFKVTRIADVEEWARRGEDDLFDLRGGPFKGIGSLAKEANATLRDAWTSGDSVAVSQAMTAFRHKHQTALLDKAPYPRADQANYRPWTRRFAQWLYSTDHISIEYGITFGGTDIQKLSPGTRGMVLLLLYLALDDADDCPLIIDQPEENLDPKSVFDELVPLFLEAKQRRQVIIVTHNANLVVNADADQIIIAHVDVQSVAGLPSITYSTGGLEEGPIRAKVCDILEGGEPAFRERARRLRISLSR